MYYQAAVVAMVVCDITRPNTMELEGLKLILNLIDPDTWEWSQQVATAQPLSRRRSPSTEQTRDPTTAKVPYRFWPYDGHGVAMPLCWSVRYAACVLAPLKILVR